MLDSRKLIASFLVLAVFTIIGVFVFSRISGVGKNQLALQNKSSGEDSTSITTRSAFLPESKLNGELLSSGAPIQTSNLTKNLTQNLGLAFSLYNQTDLTSAEAGLLPSTGLAVTESLLGIEPPIKDNALWPPVKNSELVELKKYTADDNFKYAESFTSIMERTLSSPQFLSLFDRQIDMQTVAATTFTFNQALAELKKIPTPTPLFAFHKSFVQYLQDEKNTFDAATNFDDPIKALVVIEGEKQVQTRIGLDILAFVLEYTRLDAKKLLAKSQPEYFGFFKQLGLFLQAPKALAQSLPSFPNLVPPVPAMPKLNETLSDVCDPEKLKGQENFAGRFKDMFAKFSDLFGSGGFTGGSIPGLGGSGGEDPFGIQNLLTPDMMNLINAAEALLAVPVKGVGPHEVAIDLQTQIIAEKSAEIASYAALIAQYTGDLLVLEIYRCNRMINTEVMKNELNKAMQNQTTQWVQNNGNPRFITNYQDYYRKAYLKGAQGEYQKVTGGICPEFAPQVSGLINPGSGGNINGTFNIDTLVGGSSGLGGLFSGGGIIGTIGGLIGGGSGGWPGFGTGNILGGLSGGCSLQNLTSNSPLEDLAMRFSFMENNFYGSSYINRNRVTNAAENSKNSAEQQSVANQGYKSDIVCTPETFGDITICKEDIVTPGQTVSKNVDSGVKSRYDQILNAQDFVKLAEGLAHSLGTNLIGQSGSGLYGLSLPGLGSCINLSQGGSFSFNAQGCASLVTGALTGLLSGGGSTPTPTPTPTSTATSTPPGTGTTVTCAPASQTIIIGDPADFSATNGNGTYSWIAPGGSPLTGSGSSFSTTYSLIGTKTVTVVSSGRSATCSVRVLSGTGGGGQLPGIP